MWLLNSSGKCKYPCEAELNQYKEDYSVHDQHCNLKYCFEQKHQWEIDVNIRRLYLMTS